MDVSALKKIVRFTSIYGFSRTLNKTLGRLRLSYFRKVYLIPRKKNISIVGCGQFAFCTAAYFIARNKGNVFLDCFDIDKNQQNSLANYYRINSVNSFDEILENDELEILYITSNHASHVHYAIQAMKNGIKKIYIEKPIAVEYKQLISLLKHQKKSNASLYAGYNRPYSAAIRKIRDVVPKNRKKGISLNCFVSGHVIPDDHWYRNEQEGTRICGNMGHWIDLAVHILNWDSLPYNFNIQISYSNKNEPDDNITINLTTNRNDLITLILTARTEPFEGINETINLQYEDVIAKIDDFRRLDIWHGVKKIRKMYFPKDVGHRRAIMQPFLNEEEKRDWEELVISTLLMLRITDMVRGGDIESSFDVNKQLLLVKNNFNNQ